MCSSQSMDREDTLEAGLSGLNAMSPQYPHRFCFPSLAPAGMARGHGLQLCTAIWCDHRWAVSPFKVSVFSTEHQLHVVNTMPVGSLQSSREGW